MKSFHSVMKKANEKNGIDYKKAIKNIAGSFGAFYGGKALSGKANEYLRKSQEEGINKGDYINPYTIEGKARFRDIVDKVYKDGDADVRHDLYENYYDPFANNGKGEIAADTIPTLLHEMGHAKNYESLGELKNPAVIASALTRNSLLSPITPFISSVIGNLDPGGKHAKKVMIANALLASPILLNEGAASIRSVFDREKIEGKGLWDAAEKQRSMLPAFGTYAAALAQPTLSYYLGRIAGINL